jgi:hypothetical protein
VDARTRRVRETLEVRLTLHLYQSNNHWNIYVANALSLSNPQ